MVKLNVSEAEDLISKGLLVCRDIRRSHPFGVFYGENPLDFSFPVLLLEISFVVIITHILRFLLRPLKQPRVVCEILGGIIVGPSVLGRSKSFAMHVFPENSAYVLKNIGVLGFMYFLFLCGVKMDLTMMRKASKKLWCISLLGMAIPMATTGIYGVIRKKTLEGELGKYSSIWAVSITAGITAFPALYPIVKELNLISSEVGQMALAMSTIGDVIGMFFLITLEIAKQGDAKSIAALWCTIAFLLVIVPFICGFRLVMVWIVKTTPQGKPVDQIYISAIMLCVAVIGFLSDMFGLAIANGTLWLGLAVPDGPPLGEAIVERSETIITELLMPFSFACIGMFTDLFSMAALWSKLQPLFFMVLSGFIIKVFSTLLATRFYNMTFRDGIALGLIMGLRGQVELLISLHWMDLRMITPPYFTMMVLLTAATTAVFTPLISIIYDPTRPYMIDKRRNIQHHPPNTELSIVACIHDPESVAGLISLLEVSNPTISCPFSVYALRLIELVARATAVFIDHDKQEEAYGNSVYNSIHNAFRIYQESKGDCIKVHSYTSVTPRRNLYQAICELALVKKASLIILPFHKECIDSLGKTEVVRQGVQSVNSNVLAHAPCSVAVLVDKAGFRNNPLASSMRNSTYHFAVLFLGGADSREALTLADRMAMDPNVSLTAIRFLSHKGEGEDVMEKKLDDGIVIWFWVKNEGNARVIYKEIVVRNGEETVAALQAMNEVYYDLWIVGRKQGINPVLIQGLSTWSENMDELGVIGDYVASTDVGSMSSVLVVQQQILRGQKQSSSFLLSRCF